MPPEQKLRTMIADLDGYIDRRAAELAEQRVADVAADCIRQVEIANGRTGEAEADAQRWKDCNTELRRRLEGLDRGLARSRALVESLRATKVPAEISPAVLTAAARHAEKELWRAPWMVGAWPERVRGLAFEVADAAIRAAAAAALPENDGPEVHVDWRMTPAEWDGLRAVLNGHMPASASLYVRRLQAEGKLDA
jgi:hypothetical protein